MGRRWLSDPSPAAPVAVTDAADASDNDSSRSGTAYGITGILLGVAGLDVGLLACRRAAQNSLRAIRSGRAE